MSEKGASGLQVNYRSFWVCRCPELLGLATERLIFPLFSEPGKYGLGGIFDIFKTVQTLLSKRDLKWKFQAETSILVAMLHETKHWQKRSKLHAEY